MTPQYTKLTGRTGHTITHAVRLKRYLVINCNFNPFNHFAFSEMIQQIIGIDEFVDISTYPDGTGYYIFRLATRADIAAINADIEIQFIKMFF